MQRCTQNEYGVRGSGRGGMGEGNPFTAPVLYGSDERYYVLRVLAALRTVCVVFIVAHSGP